ncbi:antibiotic biosynthesis monooxygenase [Roseomonas sp. PWR1]|uniref:Antibiotic biosynthesis monooxygenase n=1 Tax=Roseomonas nitratireducens TaxID=2820810 RepID=A0ABS4AUN1_9PROT|nr:putative quinol monooxygenase [Neoroseomonas nitratireducens]MBP0465078.1 antibiotic biosynthesis monooxygenase [Neoroseomonas nitratireducens]
MSGFVVLAEFQAKPGCLDAFLALARADAEGSLRSEPGCRRFDVTLLEDGEGRVLFYEIYDDRAAFEAHLQTPHLARFRDGFPALADQLPVRFASLQPPG